MSDYKTTGNCTIHGKTIFINGVKCQKCRDKVVCLDDMREHITIQGEKAVHVCPMAMFRDIAIGKLPFSKVDDIDDIAPRIIGEWLERFDT